MINFKACKDCYYKYNTEKKPVSETTLDIMIDDGFFPCPVATYCPTETSKMPIKDCPYALEHFLSIKDNKKILNQKEIDDFWDDVFFSSQIPYI